MDRRAVCVDLSEPPIGVAQNSLVVESTTKLKQPKKTFVRFVRGVPYTAQKGGSKTSGRGVAGRNGRKINIYNILLILFTFYPKLSSVLPTDESRTKRTKDRATDLSSVGRKSLFRTKERTKDQTSSYG